MKEEFIFSFNGVSGDVPMTMEAAIDSARNRAIAGKTVVLSVGKVKLGTYSPASDSPRRYKDPITKEDRFEPFCEVKHGLPAREY